MLRDSPNCSGFVTKAIFSVDIWRVRQTMSQTYHFGAGLSQDEIKIQDCSGALGGVQLVLCCSCPCTTERRNESLADPRYSVGGLRHWSAYNQRFLSTPT